MKQTSLSTVYALFVGLVFQFRVFEIATTFTLRQNELLGDDCPHRMMLPYLLLVAISNSSLILCFMAKAMLRSRAIGISQQRNRRFDLLNHAIMMFAIVLSLCSDAIGEYLQITMPLNNRSILSLSFRIMEVLVLLWFSHYLWKPMSSEELWTSVKKNLVEMRKLGFTCPRRAQRNRAETSSPRGRLASLKDELLAILLIFLITSSVLSSILIVNTVNSPVVKFIALATTLLVLVEGFIFFCYIQCEAYQKAKISSQRIKSNIPTISDSVQPGTSSVFLRVFVELDDEKDFQRQKTDFGLQQDSLSSSPPLQLPV